jgi:signal transduction histidine kinase/predicted CoA-binding protein
MNTYHFLKKVPLFSSMSDEDLDRLCEMIEEVRLQPGDELFAEGDEGDKAYVIKEGEIEILKASGGREVQLAVRKQGEVIGEMSLLEAAPRFASGRARTECLLLAISHDHLDTLLNTSPSAARALLYTITARYKSTELLLRQSEKMAQLGTLTAGIAHEINNPAAAAQRGANQLREEISRLQRAQLALAGAGLPNEALERLMDLDQLAQERAAQPLGLDSLDRSDREYEIETWLGDHGFENSWQLAPTLVDLGYETDQLEDLATTFPNDQIPVIVEWLEASYSIYSLLAEISQGASRISEIVKALKSYVYLDQAPVQSVDIHEGLNNTVIMLRSKLREGVTVRREFDPNLPKIEAYGSELNQVWTNLIDNAIDAMDGRGEIILRTRYDDPWVTVEVEDTGPGIPEAIQSKLFSPFFTTKPVGKGTGLGLNISYKIVEKHGGDIKVYSHPGKTRFSVRLPKNLEAIKSGEAAISTISTNDDQKLRQILETTENIAVVGISNRPELPSLSVPAYIKRHGYKIYPVNPYLDEVLSQEVYPSLSAIEDPIDLVLIFRRSEDVPPVVEEAIQLGAQTIWMQEGIVNETAAERAREAGLDVVMDTCIRTTHKRLMAGS